MDIDSEWDLKVFNDTLLLVKAVFHDPILVHGRDLVEIIVDPLVISLIIANLEFLKPVFEERVKNGMGRTKKEE